MNIPKSLRSRFLLPISAALVAAALGVGIFQAVSDPTGSVGATGGVPGSRDSTLKPPARGVAEINGQLYVNGTPTPYPSPSPVPEERRSFDPNFEIPDRVKVTFTENRGWGASCTPPEPGDKCVVPFDGVANLQTQEAGRIVIKAFEDGSPLPVAERVLEPVTKGRNFLCMRPGCPYGGAYLKYSPSQGAKVVTFRVELQDLSGRVLAFSQLDDYFLTND